MCPPNYLFLAVLGLPLGTLAAAKPYAVTKATEVVDAIGRKPSGSVEPADWNVLLTRVVGAAFAVLGAGAAVTCVL
ncbi:hypothetical protein [Halobaculum rubrum]|uniref:hypothetical protein n=1 Tax=Halobaculum rubrum TaxID=2872158 RepID=UPI001CA40AB5|nr:hypothetical protein [Halobaculum rubrum]QZY00811.1 hypothetical protein K6T25_07025 [Halobaculum rubrum]